MKENSAFETKCLCKILIDPLAVMNQLVLVFNGPCSLVKMLIRFFFSFFLSLSSQAYTIQGQYAIPHPDVSPQPSTLLPLAPAVSQQSAWLCSFQRGPLY